MDRPSEIIHVWCESFPTVVCEVFTLGFIELIVFFFLSIFYLPHISAHIFPITYEAQHTLKDVKTTRTARYKIWIQKNFYLQRIFIDRAFSVYCLGKKDNKNVFFF